MSSHPIPATGRAELDAAKLLLDKMGISPEDLLQTAQDRPPAPTFAEYVPVVSAAVGAGARRTYGSYWNRIVEQWGHCPIDEPTASEIKQLVEHARTHVVSRRNARGALAWAQWLMPETSTTAWQEVTAWS